MGKISLDGELAGLLGRDQKAQVVARYFGFDGQGGTTLRKAGAEYGISAERVRQIVAATEQHFSTLRPPAGTLDEVLCYIARQTPGWADEIELKLPAEGFCEKPFRIEGIIRAAALFGRVVSFSLIQTQKGRLVHSLRPESFDAIVRVARRSIERQGIANIGDVSADLREIHPDLTGSALIAAVIAGADDLHWLDQAGGWFWLPSVPRNPLVRRIRKVLAVANPVSAPALYAGISREYRVQSHMPPAGALLELCRQIPGVVVAEEVVRAEPPIERREALSEVELVIVEALLETGGAIPCAELVNVCRQRGLNRSSFYSSLSHSPVVATTPDGRVSLVGTESGGTSPGPVAPAKDGTGEKGLHQREKSHKIKFLRYKC